MVISSAILMIVIVTVLVKFINIHWFSNGLLISIGIRIITAFIVIFPIMKFY